MSDNPNNLENLEPADELIAQRRLIGEMPADMPPLMSRIIISIDKFSLLTGKLVCWLTVPIFISMVTEIIMRKFFTATPWAYDISRMLYGALFMLGSGYALMRGVHIRADFLYRLWKPRYQGAVDFCLYLGLYFPGLIFFLWTSSEFAFEAWARSERVADTAWMPYVAPVRTSLPVGIFLLLVQGVSETLKSYYALTRGKWPS